MTLVLHKETKLAQKVTSISRIKLAQRSSNPFLTFESEHSGHSGGIMDLKRTAFLFVLREVPV